MNDQEMKLTHDRILEYLAEVKDPEIPVLSLVDLGVITGIETDGSHITIELTPTFVGCPALDTMKQEISEVLTRNGAQSVQVIVSYRKPWTSDSITEKGKLALKNFGLAPPPAANLFTDIELLEHAKCPRCDGSDTELRNTFGPTLCRSIHYCNSCREAFEQFKPL